jgi:hypothetical protein
MDDFRWLEVLLDLRILTLRKKKLWGKIDVD